MPEARKIYVVGNIKKPGAFPVRDGSENTVLKLLAMSIRNRPLLRQRSIHLSRGRGRRAPGDFDTPLAKLLLRKAPDAPLAADDILINAPMRKPNARDPARSKRS